MFRTCGLSDAGIWKLGQLHVAGPTNRTLRARADLLASTIRKNHLRLDADDKPARHANIVDWPSDKAKRLQIAQQLAAKAMLEVFAG